MANAQGKVLASSSLTELRYVREMVLGTPPDPNDYEEGYQSRELRMTGESLNFSLSYTSSQEIRADRQTADSFLTGAEAAGSVNFELSYGEYDSLLAGVLQSDWNFMPQNVTFAAGNTFQGTFSVGDVFAIRGSARGNDGIYRISNFDGNFTYTAQGYDPALQTFTSAKVIAPGNEDVAVHRLQNGRTFQTFTLEKTFTDVGQSLRFHGMAPGQMSLSIGSGQAVTGSFTFMGMRSHRSEAPTLVDRSAESFTFPVINGVTGVGAIQEGGKDLSEDTYVNSLTLNIDNNLRAQGAIGVLGAAGVGSGTLSVTGSMEVYFTNGELYDKFIKSKDTSIALTLLDNVDPALANGYSLRLPRVRITSAEIVSGAINQDVMVNMNFEALRDADSDSMIKLMRFGADISIV